MITSLLVPFQVVMLAASSATPSVTSVPAPITATRYEYFTHSEPGAGAPQIVFRMINTNAGEQFMRMEVVESAVPPGFGMFETGTYMISDDGGRHTYTVNPVKHEYSELDSKKMLENAEGTMSALNSGSLGARMLTSGLKIDVADLGAGETILGHPTNHWRTVQTTKMTMVMGKDSIAVLTETTTDAFFGTDLPYLARPDKRKDTTSTNPYTMLGTPEEAAKAKAEMNRLPSGMPLRNVAVTVSAFGPMKTRNTNTTEITKIETVQVEPAFFQVPKGFTKVEMPSLELPPDMIRPPAEMPRKK
jgi:hypothetical protein